MVIERKVCTKCGETKPLDCFGVHPRYRGGRRRQCKTCIRADSAEYRKRPEAIRKKTENANRIRDIRNTLSPEERRLRFPRKRTPEQRAKQYQREKAKDGFLERQRIAYSRLLQTPGYKEHRKEQRATRLKTSRLEAFNHYGGVRCACCGESEYLFLQLDHINGLTGGQETRGGSGLVFQLKQQGYPEGFQVLCCNCNFAKGRRDNPSGICPHQRGRLKLVNEN